MAILGSDYENCLDLLDRNHATLTLMFQLKLTIPQDRQVTLTISNAVLAFWSLILASNFFKCKVLLGHLIKPTLSQTRNIDF